MKKVYFLFITILWMMAFAQMDTNVVSYTDSMYTEVDSTIIDSLLADSTARKDTLATYSIGLDTTYLKTIQKIDTQKVAFMEGVKFFNSKKYYDALQVFENMKQIPEEQNEYLSAVDMMITKTYLRLGNFEKAIYCGFEFESRHENSNYLDDVQFTIADAFMSEARYNDALLYYLNVLKNTSDNRMVEKCQESIDILIDIFLTIEEIETLNNTIKDKFFNFILSLKIIEKKHYIGADFDTDEELSKLRRKAKSDFFKQEYKRTVEKIENIQGGQNYIGVILPLTGNEAYSKIAKEILQGVRVAILRFNKRSDKKISAIVMDNKGEMVTSVKHARYLTKNPRVIAIFGPVKSENVIAAGTYANENQIPLISPTAEFNGITELGPWVFQANLNLKNVGDYIGKYCTTITQNPNIVTLAPLTERGEQLTDSFSEAIDITGGRILSQQWYNNAEKLAIQFMDIRRAGVALAREKIKFKTLEMRDELKKLSMKPGSRWNRDDCFLNVTDSICQLFEHGAVKEMSVRRALIYTGLMKHRDFKVPPVDSLDVRIASIDGMFLPTNREDLELIIPNIIYYNFSGNIYGTRNQISSNVLRRNATFASKFYFISDFYIDKNSQRYRSVSNDYIKIAGAKPDRFGVYGYDTMSFLLMAFHNSNSSRENMKKQLMNAPVYHGIGRNISFNGNQPGSNSCAFILNYRRGVETPVARVEKGKIILGR